jgi:cyanate lyase
MKTTPTQTPSSCKANSVLTKEQMTDRIYYSES